MNYLKAICLVLPMVYFSCANNTPTDQEPQPTPSDSTISDPVSPATLSSEDNDVVSTTTRPMDGLIYRGKIGERSIRMMLTTVYRVSGANNTDVTAYYSYENEKETYYLTGKLKDNNRMILKGEENTFTGRVDEEGIYTGNWSIKGQRESFELYPTCPTLPEPDESFEAFIAKLTPIKLPLATAEIEGCWGCNDMGHLFAVGLYNCIMDLESLVNLGLMEAAEDGDYDDYTAHYGGYFINTAGHYVVLYMSGMEPDFYGLEVCIFSQSGELLDTGLIGEVTQGVEGTTNFYIDIDTNGILHTTEVGGERAEYDEELDEYGEADNWAGEPTRYDLSGDKILY